jgi:hypothetical protein
MKISDATTSIVVVQPTGAENSGKTLRQGVISSAFESVLVGAMPTGIGTIDIGVTETIIHGSPFTVRTMTGVIQAIFATETASYEAAFTSGTGNLEAIFASETVSYGDASTTGSGTAEPALTTENVGLEGGIAETATISYISELVSAVTETITFEAYQMITSALQNIDSEEISTEVEPQNNLATPGSTSYSHSVTHRKCRKPCIPIPHILSTRLPASIHT